MKTSSNLTLELIQSKNEVILVTFIVYVGKFFGQKQK